MATQGNVLIVDDDILSRDACSLLLTGQGYELFTASHATEALSTARTILPDLILLDVMMPGVDGFTLCQQVRADPVLAEVPIVMLTALGDKASRLRGLTVGADDILTKPFDAFELRARVQTIIRLNRYRRLHHERLERMRVEQEAARQMAELAALREADRRKSEFVAVVSHELRSPLTVLTLLAGNLTGHYHTMTDTQRLRAITDLRANLVSFNHLVEQMLSVGQIDMHGGELPQTRASLPGLLESEVNRLAPLAQQQSVTVSHTCTTSAAIIGHIPLLRRAMANIIENAIKYTPSGGAVCCWAGEADAELLTVWNLPGDQRWLLLTIADTGAGIPPEEQEQIFDRFYRSASAPASGTGLGLAIVRDTLAMHGGHVRVQSSSAGSTFLLCFPYATEHSDDSEDCIAG